MPDASQKLALEIAAQSEQALNALNKVKKSINEVNQDAEASIAVDKKVIATQQAMTRSSSGLTSAQRKTGQAINATSSDLEQMIGTLTEGDQAAQELTGSVISGASAFLMMGPAAAGAMLAIQGVQLIIKQATKALENMKTVKFAEEIVAGMHSIRSATIIDLDASLAAVSTFINEVRSNLVKVQNDLRVMMDESASYWEKKWTAMHYSATGNIQAAVSQTQTIIEKGESDIAKVQEKELQDQEKLINIVEGGHYRLIKTYPELLKYIEYRKTLVGMTADEELRALRYAEKYLDVKGKDYLNLLSREQDLQEKTVKTAVTGINKRAEMEKQLRDDVMQLTMETYYYKLAKLDEEYERNVKIVDDKVLLEQWYALETLAIMGERLDELAEMEDEAREKREREAEKIANIEAKLHEDLMRMSMDSTDFQIMQIEAQAEAYREAGVDEVKIAEWKNAKIAKIQEEALQEQMAQYREQAEAYAWIAREAFETLSGAKAEATEWAKQMDKDYTVSAKQQEEVRKAMQKKALWTLVQEQMKALAWQMAKESIVYAIAFAASGFTNVVAGLKAAGYAAAAAAAGGGAAMAGAGVRAAGAAIENVEASIEKQRETQREAEERAKEPTQERGARETAPRITNSTFNFKFEIWNIFHGDIIGYQKFEDKLARSIRTIAMRGKLDYLRDIT